jgi:nucleoid-associated protein YgaU
VVWPGYDDRGFAIDLAVTLAIASVNFKHLFDRHAVSPQFCRPPVVDIEPAFDRMLVRVRWYELEACMRRADVSVAYELPPQVRRVRPQAPAVVLQFPCPAPEAESPAELVVDGQRDTAPSTVLLAPAEDLRAPVDIPAPVQAPRGPVACPSSRPMPARPVREVVDSESRSGGVRLTVRGRRLRALICAGALIVAGWITVSAAHSALSSPVIPSSAPAVVQVHQGDTLWSIAAKVAPRQDPRRVVAALRSANHLDSNTVRPGQQLRVPR